MGPRAMRLWLACSLQPGANRNAEGQRAVRTAAISSHGNINIVTCKMYTKSYRKRQIPVGRYRQRLEGIVCCMVLHKASLADIFSVLTGKRSTDWL